ncbi:MAG: sulfotransferase [Nocardioidaceae bacterium]
MTWKSAANRALVRTTGRMLVRADRVTPVLPAAAATAPGADVAAAPPGQSGGPKRVEIPVHTTDEVRGPVHPEADRLLDRPVFLFSPVRSGSTLLRLMLNAHPQLHAPHELHVRRLRVVATTALATKAMDMLGHNEADLEHLLWDRVLHRELTLSGKQFIVDKTPSNAFAFRRIQTAWPDARFIFLLRHPASIAASWSDASTGRRTGKESVADALRYMRATERARANLPGLTVRYEELTADPEKVTREICDFLDVEWDSAMLEYGGRDTTYVKGVGDWSDKIRSGAVQAGRSVPRDEDVPARLVPICRTWGYLADDAEPTPTGP